MTFSIDSIKDYMQELHNNAPHNLMIPLIVVCITGIILLRNSMMR
ncbi:MAG: hypothetical protein AABX17_04160 [Nanoarchaeota archaeon]